MNYQEIKQVVHGLDYLKKTESLFWKISKVQVSLSEYDGKGFLLLKKEGLTLYLKVNSKGMFFEGIRGRSTTRIELTEESIFEAFVNDNPAVYLLEEYLNKNVW